MSETQKEYFIAWVCGLLVQVSYGLILAPGSTEGMRTLMNLRDQFSHGMDVINEMARRLASRDPEFLEPVLWQ